MFKQYFGIEEAPAKFEYAHIKPVFKIKEEFLNSNYNESILDEISDPNNFLPLPENIHSYYDNYLLYWNEDGQLELISNDVRDKDIEEYKKINDEKVNQIRIYSGNKYKVVDEIHAGDIATIVGLNHLSVGEGLGNQITRIDPCLVP